MKIRELSGLDKDQWINLASKADKRNKDWAKIRFNTCVNTKKKRKILVIEKDGKLIGFIGIKGQDIGENVSKELNDNYLLISWLALLTEYRNNGIGSLLLKKADDYKVKWGKIGIWTGCKEKLIPFYEKNGFKLSGNFINNRNNKENLMIKS